MKNILIFSFIFISLSHDKIFAQNDNLSIDGLMQKGQYSQALIGITESNCSKGFK